MGPKKVTEFRWTDDEIELLLQCCLTYKSEQEYKGINWEDVRNKYEKIRDQFTERYPSNEADAERFPSFAKLDDIITKDRVAAKIKNIRTDFKKACDSGKKSGGGRVVFANYSICQGLWGSCPAVNTISNGIDSQDAVLTEEAITPLSSTGIDETSSGNNSNENNSSYQNVKFCIKYAETMLRLEIMPFCGVSITNHAVLKPIR